ncbi:MULTISPECIES: EAL domain-containing protein [unclassified Pseudomonas]|uniref:putative bifunctional diguanylate cyclase/phosphodiesterase n=1 Tax=unclassified Pseudomonas TaxID=196821 RepID=UPI000D358360|nr:MULTISPECIES: EAL domain-containing protein [unclassified Pseudomonas]RAU44826.1 EAL domain-containing protein [Pseudomonas sp. RIT 409]RAU53603.1 EAL domain-containing protein [Pseudomonas sp. RIT 412]
MTEYTAPAGGALTAFLPASITDDTKGAAPEFRVWLWGGLALAIALLLGALLGWLHQQAQRQAISDVGNLSRILEARLSNTFHDIPYDVQNVPLEKVREVLRDVDVGAHGVITLRRTDVAQNLLRMPPAPLGTPAPSAADPIGRMLTENAKEGTLITFSPVDGVKRLYSFRRIDELPLALVIGLAAEDYLLGWKYTVIASSIVCGGLYLLVVSLTLRLQANRLRRQQILDELRDSAFHDEMTGLPNRRYLLERVNQAINEGDGVSRLSLFYIDVDNFKTINDSLGHVAGDTALTRLAQRLLALRPTVDTVARLSGDEFLVLVNDDDFSRIAQIIKDVLYVMQQPLELAGYTLSVSASVGIAAYPAHGHDFGSLLKAADTAMAQAKRNGRNTWVLYEAAMGARELRFLHVQSELRLAFEQRELQVHYQPQIDLGTGAVIGAEALLRWNHPGQGPIAPGEFIPVAESSGLIIPISRWLLHQVCHQAVAWQAAGLGELSVAMNCSAVQFRQGNLVQDVRRALYESGLKPHLLELELTESILIEHSERVLDTVRGLKALGVRMSIDDFGTGYSSMAYLKRFAVDKLKIDQSFVRGMLSNAQDAAIVQAVITLGHSFDMKVIAEGVEDFSVLDALRVRGCDEAQGYYYAKALEAHAFETFLQERIEFAFTTERWV